MSIPRQMLDRSCVAGELRDEWAGVRRKERTRGDPGRQLFAATRTRRTSQNDSDRLRKYLARFELDWAAVQDGPPVP